MIANSNLNAFFHDLEREENRRKLELALPKHVDVDSFARIVIHAVESEPKLYDADRGSLMRACLEAAQDGLLPDGREGAIVPFRHRNSNHFMAQWQPMVWGLVKLVRQSEQLVDIAAHIVREADSFDHWVDEKGEHFTHRPDYARADSAPVLAYAFARLLNGGFYFEPMDWSEVERFRELSKAKADDTPWSKWPDEMAKVRPLKRLCKRLPMTTNARAAFARDDEREAVLFDTRPDDPLQAINRTIRDGTAPPAANARQALTNDPSPTLDIDIPPRSPERVMRTSGTTDAQVKPRRAGKPAKTAPDAPTIEREPTLEEVLQRIDVAGNSDELAAAAALAAQMRSEGAKKIARDAYSHKVAALHAAVHAAAQANPSQDEQGPSAPTYAKVRDRIEHAQSLGDLDEAIDMARALPQPDYREELLDIAHARRDGFTQ